ncbi:diguanylate cyclase, partial [Patescibacteria group bacterium]|nr:diguanylate cyclase [Patescibacteria group bacterium]
VVDRHETKYRDAIENFKAGGERSEDLLKVLITRQEFLMDVERFDISGAYGPEEFHADMGSYFGETRSYEQDEQGLLKQDASDDKYTFLAVTFNSLAAANKIQYNQGNASLHETVTAMERALVSAGLSVGDFKIYRLKGSDFVIRLEKEKLASGEDDDYDDNLKNITHSISTSQTSTGKKISSLYGGVTPKILVTDPNRGDAVNMFNNLQERSQSRGKETVQFDQEYDAQKYLTTLFMDVLEAKREQEFLSSLMDGVIKQARNSVHSANEKDAIKAKEFYDLFIAKFFSGTEFGNYDVLFPGENVEDLDTYYNELASKLTEVTAMLAAERIFGSREEKSHVTELLTELCYQKLGGSSEEKVKKVIESDLITYIESQGQASTKFELFPDSDAKEVPLTEIARRFQTVQKFHNELLNQSFIWVNSIISDGVVSQDERATLQEAIGQISKYLDESGSYYLDSKVAVGSETYDLQEVLTQNVQDWSAEKISLVSDLLGLVVKTHELKFDKLTGLPKKETFYRETDDMVFDALMEGKNLTFAFGDLAYLRYINDHGGRLTGNNALNVTAASFEWAAQMLEGNHEDIDYFLSRLGGDEFTALIEASVPNMSGIEAQFAEAFLDMSGKVKLPASKETISYMPNTLNLNLGFCSLDWGLRGIEGLLAAEAFGPEDSQVLQNVLEKRASGEIASVKPAELAYFSKILLRTMSRVAEKSMEISKAKQRALYLYGMYERLQEAEISQNTLEYITFNTIFTYSQKAMKDVRLEDFNLLYTEINQKSDLTLEQKASMITNRFGAVESGQDASHFEVILKELVEEHLKK